MRQLKYFLALLVMSPVFCLAQTFSKEDTAKSKEIEISLTELVSKAANNFENLRGEKLSADKAFIKYKTKGSPKMYAQQYSITQSTGSQKYFYNIYYTEPHAMNLAIICLANITSVYEGDWVTTEATFDDKDLQGAWLRYKGTVVGQVITNSKEKTLSISIGVYNGETEWIKEEKN